MNHAAELRKMVAELVTKIEAKNRSYGDSFADSAKTFGDKSLQPSARVLRAYCLRVSDKLHRINALINAQEVSFVGEGVKDALEDVMGYTLVVFNSLWNDLQMLPGKHKSKPLIKSSNPASLSLSKRGSSRTKKSSR